MAKKFIDIMDTSFRDGFQSVYGGRVLFDDFSSALEAGVEAGINHFEFGGGARFQSLFFYLNENAFDMMDKFRSIAGDKANLQTLSRGINTVMLTTASNDIIDLHAKLFKKHGATTIRNFDALNDVRNLEYSSQCIKKYGLKHEVVVTMMDLPPKCKGAHDVAFYKKILKDILDSDIEFDSVCFKDASGTSSPNKVYESIKMAREFLPDNTHIRLHTHETAGISVASYLAALEAGVDGIDLAASPVSGGTSQPDILTLMHATKGMDYDLGGFEIDKILSYEREFQNALSKYYLPSEATQVLPIIPMSPMPGGALTANTQMMRDTNTMHHFNDTIHAMQEVVEKGGYGTSVTPVSQFYWQQAYANVLFGKWKKITDGYGKMVLGYFGKTPVAPDEQIVKLASEQLKLKPTSKNPIDMANDDKEKSKEHYISILKKENLEESEENIFIVAACEQKGVDYLKGNAQENIRLKENNNIGANMSNNYKVTVDGEVFNVTIEDGGATSVQKTTPKQTTSSSNNSSNVNASLSGKVFKILASSGSKVKEGDTLVILESMKMEIEVCSPCDGIVKEVLVHLSDNVEEGQTIVTVGN